MIKGPKQPWKKERTPVISDRRKIIFHQTGLGKTCLEIGRAWFNYQWVEVSCG